MLEREEAKNTLLGVEMELNDGAFPLLHGIVGTVDPVTAFTGVDAIVMVSANFSLNIHHSLSIS
jgi:malate dehydrogenase